MVVNWVGQLADNLEDSTAVRKAVPWAGWGSNWVDLTELHLAVLTASPMAELMAVATAPNLAVS